MRSVLLGNPSRAAIGIAACAVAFAIPATAGAAAPGSVTRIPEGSVLTGREASNLTLGADGRIWFGASTTDVGGPATNGVIGAIDQSAGTIVPATDPTNSPGGIYGPIAADPGRLWFVRNYASGASNFALLKTSDCSVTNYGGSAYASGNKVVIQPGPAGSAIYKADSIDSQQAAIGAVTPSGAITERVAGLTYGMTVGALAVGGNDTWFAESMPNSSGVVESGLGRLSSSTGLITEYPISGLSSTPSSRWTLGKAITGPDGNIWLTLNPVAPNTISAIAKFPLGGGPVQTNVTAGRTLNYLQAGPDGNLWAVETWTPVGNPADKKSSALVKISTANVLLGEYPLPNGRYAINKPVFGPDGNWWMAAKACTASASCGSDSTKNWFERVSPTGAAAEFDTGLPLDTEHKPGTMITGSDHRIWFVDNWTSGGVKHGAIAQLQLNGTAPALVTPTSACRFGSGPAGAGGPSNNPAPPQIASPQASAAIVVPSAFSSFHPAALFLAVSAKAGKKLTASISGVAEGQKIKATWTPKLKTFKTVTSIVPVTGGAARIVVPKKRGVYRLTIKFGNKKLAAHGVKVK